MLSAVSEQRLYNLSLLATHDRGWQFHLPADCLELTKLEEIQQLTGIDELLLCKNIHAQEFNSCRFIQQNRAASVTSNQESLIHKSSENGLKV